MKILRLILGDQLSESISSLQGYNSDADIILMCEVLDEATYVNITKRKLRFYFLQCGILLDGLKIKALMLNILH